MKSIEKELEPLSGYLLSIKRNTKMGWYELEVGVPADWIYKSNKYINCEVVKKSDVGHILKIAPKEDGTSVDDLVAFVKLIIETNSKIREKEKEFKDQMNRVKEDLESQAKDFYKQLNKLKEDSFDKFNVDGKSNQKSTESANDDVSENDEKKSENSEEKVTTTKTTKKRGRPSKKATNEQKEGKQ